MGLIIDNYMASCGLAVNSAYLTVDNFYCDILHNSFTFSFSVFVNKEEYLKRSNPLDAAVISGYLDFPGFNDINLVQIAEDALLTKLQNIRGKTPAECQIHNKDVDLNSQNAWINLWDIELLPFVDAYKEIENSGDE